MASKNSLKDAAKSKAVANRLAKTLTTDELAKAIINLQGALKTAQQREKEKASKARAANIKKLTALMADMGLSPSDITSSARKKAANKKHAPLQKKRPQRAVRPPEKEARKKGQR